MSEIVHAPAPDPEPRYGRSMSIEAWEQMDEDEPGELVDGRLEEEEVSDNPHEVLVSALLYLLSTWARPRRGVVLVLEAAYAISNPRDRKLDKRAGEPGRSAR